MQFQVDKSWWVVFVTATVLVVSYVILEWSQPNFSDHTIDAIDLWTSRALVASSLFLVIAIVSKWILRPWPLTREWVLVSFGILAVFCILTTTLGLITQMVIRDY